MLGGGKIKIAKM